MKPDCLIPALAALATGLSTLVVSASSAAVEVRQIELSTPGADIPLYIAKPDGPGPFPPVLFIHAKRGPDIAAIVSYFGHRQSPNAPEPDQLFRVAPEVMQLTTPILFLIGEQDFELLRMVGGRAFYALWERGVPVEYQVYPFARRAFDFRNDQGPEEKIAARHARQRADRWLRTWMKLDDQGRCPAP